MSESFATPWTIDHHAPLSVEFPRQDYWNELPFQLLLQGIFPTQGSNPCLLHWQADPLPLSHQGSPSRERIEERNTQPLLFLFFSPCLLSSLLSSSLPPMLLNGPLLKSEDQVAQSSNSSGSAPKDIEQSEEVVSGSEGVSERCPASQPSRQMAKRLKCVC